jgi:hypothetical protein
MIKILFSKSFVLALALLGFVGMAGPQQVPPQQAPGNATNLVQTADRVASITRDWMEGKNSAQGASVEFREVARANNGGQLKVQYRFFVKGAPNDQTYMLISWPITAANPSVLMKSVSISANGLVLCAGTTPGQCGDANNKDDPIALTFSPRQGEVIRLAFVSADQKTRIFAAIVPDPIIKTSMTCSAEIVRLSPKFELALFLAKGFQPNEDLLFQSKSYDESQDEHVKANAGGGYVTAMLPFVKGKPNGSTFVQLKGESCAPELSFEWGK